MESKYYKILERYNPHLLQDVIKLLVDPENRKILKFLYAQREYVLKQLPPISCYDSKTFDQDNGLQLLDSMTWEAKSNIKRFNTLEYISKRLKIDKPQLKKILKKMHKKNLVESYEFVNKPNETMHILMTEEGYGFIRDKFLKGRDSWEI